MKLFFLFKDMLFVLCCFILSVDLSVFIFDNDIYIWNPFLLTNRLLALFLTISTRFWFLFLFIRLNVHSQFRSDLSNKYTIDKKICPFRSLNVDKKRFLFFDFYSLKSQVLKINLFLITYISSRFKITLFNKNI